MVLLGGVYLEASGSIPGESEGGIMGAISTADVEKWASKGKVKKLIKALEEKDDYVVKQAAKALVATGDERAVEPLIAAIDRVGRFDQVDLIAAVGTFRDPRAIPALIKMLGASMSMTGEAAAAALDKMGEPTVLPLIETLKSPDLALRKWAAQLLGRQRDARAVEPLMAAVDDPDGNMRLISAGALAQIGDARAIPALERVLSKQYENDYAKSDVKAALETLKKGEQAFIPGGNVKVTIKISGAMHGSTEFIGEYEATLPLDAQGPQLLNSLATSILKPGSVRYYNGYQLMCPGGTLRSSADGSITKPVTPRDAGVTDGAVLEFIDWGGDFI